MAKKLMRRGPGRKTLHLGRRISKFSPEARRTVTGKTSVRRLQVRDPARALTDERIAKQITNNPNLKYQPTGVIGSQAALQQATPGATVLRVPNKPRPSTAGKGRVIRKPRKVIRKNI